MKLNIHNYLENYISQTRRGSCKSCQKDITWKRDALISHKRASCSFEGNASFFEKFPQWRNAKSSNLSSVSATKASPVPSEGVEKGAKTHHNSALSL